MQKLKLNLLGIVFLLLGVGGFAQYTEEDWAERDEWMDVGRIFQLAELESGNSVADIGCHEGYLSMHLAKKVGKEGKVFSVDINERRLSTLKQHAEKRGYKNITTVLGDYDDPKLPEKSLDLVFVVDSYHEMTDYRSILGHIKKALRPGGKIVVLEKLKDHVREKSRREQAQAHTLSPKYVRKELKEAGFDIVKEIRDFGNWEKEKSKKIWMLVGTVPPA